jgi:CheY-like chemotaxis protein
LRICPTEDLPELMVIDYKMPGITGAEVLQSIQQKERYQNIPKVVWSTSNNQEYRDRSMKSGASQFLTKPADMQAFDEMVDLLNKLL